MLWLVAQVPGSPYLSTTLHGQQIHIYVYAEDKIAAYARVDNAHGLLLFTFQALHEYGIPKLSDRCVQAV